MANWQHPDTLMLCMAIYAKVVIFLLGIFFWFFLESWHAVEGALLSGRMSFKPTHFSYLVARYGQFITLIFVCTLVHLPSPIVASCRIIALPRATTVGQTLTGATISPTDDSSTPQVIGNISVVAASANLGFRAFMLWQDCRTIRITMMMCCFGHFIYALLMGVLSVKPVWNSHHTKCVILTSELERAVAGFYVYTLVWDSVILALTIFGLRKTQEALLPSKRPSILKALTSQGVGYGIISWIVTVPMTITMLLNLNVALNILMSTPGTTISVLASCKMVLSLQNAKQHSNKEWASSSAFHSTRILN
ncbi:hypothetical protein BC629DRAFT_1586991 [Irpex lacteus]|nr:hypothetical protein BC629DRAFT_1586991 [Irpex lacteus]